MISKLGFWVEACLRKLKSVECFFCYSSKFPCVLIAYTCTAAKWEHFCTQSLEFILKKIAMFIWTPCICSIRMSINSGKGWLSRHYNIIKVTRFYSKLINNNKIINWLVNQLINILWSYSSQKHLVLNKKKVRIKGIEVLPQIQIF